MFQTEGPELFGYNTEKKKKKVENIVIRLEKMYKTNHEGHYNTC